MDLWAGELHSLYPFQSHFLDLDGHRLHYVDEGQGPALVLLHGNPTWSFYYRDLIRSLRDRYRIVAPDHIGCGLSDKPQDYPYTLATHMANVGRLIDHLGLSKLSLGVHDWGGAIGFGWAVKNPKRLGRLIVFNTAAFLGGPTPWRIRICRWPVVGEIIVRALNGFARPALTMAVSHHGRLSRDVRRGYLLPYGSYADRVGVLRFVRDIPQTSRVPSHAVLAAIGDALPTLADVPMLICWGARDFCFNDRYLDEWKRRFPKAEAHRFADAGHYVLEDAGGRILPLVDGFLSRTEAGPSLSEIR